MVLFSYLSWHQEALVVPNRHRSRSHRCSGDELFKMIERPILSLRILMESLLLKILLLLSILMESLLLEARLLLLLHPVAVVVIDPSCVCSGLLKGQVDGQLVLDLLGVPVGRCGRTKDLNESPTLKTKRQKRLGHVALEPCAHLCTLFLTLVCKNIGAKRRIGKGKIECEFLSTQVNPE